MRTLVVPDLHGRYGLALALLRAAGIVDGRGTRIDYESRIVQFGDLANCVGRDRDGDLRLLRKARAWFDVLLVGNHEHPYFGGSAFTGFMLVAEVERAVRNLTWQPAIAVGGTLVTHAGVHPGWKLPADAALAEGDIRAAWQQRTADHPLIAQIGPARRGLYAEQARRFGLPLFGGVLWRDASEDIDTGFNQVYGHTVNPDGPIRVDHPNGCWAINLDCGGHHDVRRIVGVWLDAAGGFDGFVEAELPATVPA